MSGETRPGEVYKGPLPKGTKRLRRHKTESEEDFNLRKANTRKEAAAKAAASRATKHAKSHPSDHPLAKFARVWNGEGFK